jgi:hypothetical protein
VAMSTLVRAVGVLACVMIVYLAASKVAEQFAPQKERDASGALAGIEGMPALAIEFAPNAPEVDAFLGARGEDGDSPMRAKIRRALRWDNFLIPLYWLLFVGMSALLARRERPGVAFWLALFAALFATAGAVSDLLENSRTRTLLDAAAVTEPLVRSAASASFWKWLLISLSILALSPVFLWAGGARARVFGGILFFAYASAGVLMLCGIVGGRPRLVQLGFAVNGVGALLIAVAFSAFPVWVARQL